MTSQVAIFSQPRSGCHLLERLLEGQTGTTPLFRPFEQAWHEQLVEWLRLESHGDGMPPSMCAIFEKEVKDDVEQWKKELSQAERNGKTMMMHTHSFFPASPDRILEYVLSPSSKPSTGDNFTLVPDSLFLHPGTVPVITIRHPAMVVPSAYKAILPAVIKGGGRANMLIITCHVWGRLLYDFYEAHGIQPLVIDADDYMTSEDFVRGFCKQAGLNPDEALFSWPTATEEQQEKLAKPFVAVQTTLMGSQAANPGRAAKSVDLAAEEAKWEEEFGVETSREIRELIDLAMPHFEYLFERRLRI